MFAGSKNKRTFAAVLEHILNKLFSETLKLCLFSSVGQST